MNGTIPALYRGGRPAVGGGVEALRADRFYDHLADRVADRGTHPAALYARRGRPPVPRIRHNPRGHDRHLRGGCTDARPDDVRQDPASPACIGTVAGGAQEPAMVRCPDRSVWKDAELGARPPAADVAGGARHARSHRVSLYRDPEGLFPGPGHRAYPRDLGVRAFGLLRGNGPTLARVSRSRPPGHRRT